MISKGSCDTGDGCNDCCKFRFAITGIYWIWKYINIKTVLLNYNISKYYCCISYQINKLLTPNFKRWLLYCHICKYCFVFLSNVTCIIVCCLSTVKVIECVLWSIDSKISGSFTQAGSDLLLVFLIHFRCIGRHTQRFQFETILTQLIFMLALYLNVDLSQ